jgi:hypothetical protein
MTDTDAMTDTDVTAAAEVLPADVVSMQCALCEKPFKAGTGRGVGGTVCSRAQCRKQIYGANDKDARISELRARLDEKDRLVATQAELIRMLQQQLSGRGCRGWSVPV